MESMIEQSMPIIVSIIISVIASSGFWAWLMNKGQKKSLQSQMLLGLAHDRIIELGTKYLKRGKITPDELENLVDYLYKPYAGLGGNGSAETIVHSCERLKVETPDLSQGDENENENE